MMIFLNGSLVNDTQAAVSVFDHGLLYGDGVFEGIRCYQGRVFKLEEHIDRLINSAKGTNMVLPYSREQLIAWTVQTVRANGLRDCYVRLVVTRGTGDLGLNPRKCKEPTIFIIAAGLKMYPPECYEKGLVVVTAATRRMPADVLPPQIKSLNYLNNILAVIEALQAECDEAILLNAAGHVAEATGDNVFLVKDGVLRTPCISCGALPGITRATVLALARARGIPTEVGFYGRFDLYTADECFLTGTGAEVVPVRKIDGRTIGEGHIGPVTHTLLRDYRELTCTTGVPVYDDVTATA